MKRGLTQQEKRSDPREDVDRVVEQGSPKVGHSLVATAESSAVYSFPFTAKPFLLRCRVRFYRI